MKVIFDENIPWPLHQFLAHHEVTTVQAQGWSGIGNGELLRRVDGLFEVLVLADRNLRYQQPLTRHKIAVVELPTNRWPVLQKEAVRIVQVIDAAEPGSYTILTL
jgi:hypothetical protein